jgi:pimeloyl-ACP methyl ester carboxylesterase
VFSGARRMTELPLMFDDETRESATRFKEPEMSVIDGSVGTESGRRVAYAQMGRLDGTPLLYFHGDPGSRLDFDQPLSRAALDESGVRLIGIDRPGFGRSTHQAGRRHRDWPSDVLAVADELGIYRFGILAYSAGGPYAVACALAFPERLTFVGIVSGIGPAETPRHREGMPRTAVTAIGLSRRVPAVVRWAVKHTSPERFSRQFDKELLPSIACFTGIPTFVKPPSISLPKLPSTGHTGWSRTGDSSVRRRDWTTPPFSVRSACGMATLTPPYRPTTPNMWPGCFRKPT